MIPQRIKDRDAIEHRLLDLAYTTDAKLTAPALAYFAPCSFADAEAVLDDLTARDRIRMEIEDDGTIAYTIPDRMRFPGTRPAPAAARVGDHVVHELPHPGLVRAVQAPVALATLRGANPIVAAMLSMVIPGAGQLYAGRWLSAVMWFMVVGLGYWLILPGLVMHFFCILSAASSAHRLNMSIARMELATSLRA